MQFRAAIGVLAALLSVSAVAQESNETPGSDALRARREEAENRALFRSTDTLPLTIETNFGLVEADRELESKKLYPGVIRMSGPNNRALEIPVQISARGNLRRKSCEFVPLRITFPKEGSKGTVFEIHGASLKLITHCENSADYEQYVLREYLAYRIGNIITPRSFRARLAHVTYVDSAKKKNIATRYAVFLEDDGDVARRLGGKVDDTQGLLFDRVHPVALIEMSLFEYMIGNSDYSIYAQHNVRIVSTSVGLNYPIPYDFDVTGFVNVPYAIPDPKLHVNYLTDRVYRGPCRTPEQWAPTLKMFESKKADILAQVDAVPDLTGAARREVTNFLAGFFSVIEKPSSVKSNLVDHCLKHGN